MPEEFLAFAVDGDGDDRKDIWSSIPDAMATTANVLKHRGWNGDQRSWGYEVRMPEDHPSFSCLLEGPDHRRPISEWVETFGITRAGGRVAGGRGFPNPDDQGTLLLPAGAHGPAFLVTDNFDVLRSYNPADLYALFVGHLTDRILCDAGRVRCTFATPWPAARGREDFPYSVENLCRLQLALEARGFSPGPIDGLFGARTRHAIGRYQQAQGQRPDCYPSRKLFEALVGHGDRVDVPIAPDGNPPVPAQPVTEP